MPRVTSSALFRRVVSDETSRAAFFLVAVLPVSIAAGSGTAAQSDPSSNSPFTYGDRGLQFESADGNNLLWFGVRLQTRFSESETEQEFLPGLPSETENELELRRGRLKLGGHLVTPRLTLYSEYDTVNDRLIDLRSSFAFTDWLNVRVGQWKSEFNRERVDSSGAQQFVERSITTPVFTIDRQKGIVASGRMLRGSKLDTSFWFGRLSGAGRGGPVGDADGLWLGRLQWNFHGRVLAFSQSNLSQRERPAGSVAIAAVSGKSRFTRFSGSGGGQLDGYTDGLSDQYRLEQFLFETAWQHKGFSWQQELHWKKLTDRVNNTEQRLRGGYAQTGMFFADVWQAMPEPLEFAIRYAFVKSGEISGDRDEQEYSVVANWFFHGHRNKLTADFSRLQFEGVMQDETESRIRLQWDVSF